MICREKNKKAEYKSAVRSRNLISESYLTLLNEKKDIKQITVTDIVKRAGINRTTFYAHYKSPAEIIESIIDEFTVKITGFLSEFKYDNFLENPMILLDKVAAFLHDNMESYRMLLSIKGSLDFVQRLRSMLIHHIRSNSTVPERIRNEQSYIIAVTFFAGGIVAVYQDWVRGTLCQPLPLINSTVSAVILQAAAPFK